MKAYSTDLRGRVLAASEGGMGTAEAAETFAVSESWVRRVKQRFRDGGEVAPRTPARRGPAPVLADQSDRLRAAARDHPGLTAAGYRDRLGLTASVVTVWRALRRLGLTHKKSPSGRPSRTARMSPASGPRGGPR
jgi:transposase